MITSRGRPVFGSRTTTRPSQAESIGIRKKWFPDASSSARSPRNARTFARRSLSPVS
jgi:hypothetical protein